LELLIAINFITIRRKKKHTLLYYLALWGCLATGLIYLSIGVIAILSFLKLKHGGADEASLLAFLDQYFIGKIFIGFILLGMVSYTIWRIYEAVKDPYGYGNDVKGILRRSVTALSSLADILIAFSAMQALSGSGDIKITGQPTAQRNMARHLLGQDWGYELLLATGIITCIVAIVQLGYVITKTYVERMDIKYMEQGKKNIIHVLAWTGHFARGIILGIIGFFFIKSATEANPQLVVNTDKAFDFIGDDVGHLYFIMVAAGTICYGIFMFVFGWYYDTDKG